MKKYALTGNMGCGKSTVCKFLSIYPDVRVIDCDLLAKDVLISTEHRQKICQIIGENVYASGQPDFRMIARIVFNNHVIKKNLENFVHPIVWKLVEEIVFKGGNDKIFIVESALIFESGIEKLFDGVIVVTCDEDEQIRRLVQFRGMSLSTINARLASQLPVSKKVKKADFLIDTNCSQEELNDRIRKLYEGLKQKT